MHMAEDGDQKNTFLFDKNLHLLSNLIVPPSDSNMECIITTNCNECSKLLIHVRAHTYNTIV